MRDDLAKAHSVIWASLGAPGDGWSGAERSAIVAETRAATSCALCRARKDAVSPYAVEGTHDVASDLDPAHVEVVHRITSDPQRLSEKLLDDWLASGRGHSEAAYVGMLGVIVLALAIDMAHRTMGAPPLSLPPAKEGQAKKGRPNRRSAAEREDIGAWVSVQAAKSPELRRILAGALRVSNVGRALSLAPQAWERQVQLIAAQYVALASVPSTASSGRAITRAQMELVAGRVSALNECFY